MDRSSLRERQRQNGSGWHRAYSSARTPTGPIYYNTNNFAALLCQWYGSSWPRVLPWCLANVLAMILLTALKANASAKALPWLAGQTPLGHTMTGLIVSFLLVNRISTALNRYTQYRAHIGVILAITRELVQKGIVYSLRGEDEERGRGWRSELAYRCLLLAKTTACNSEYPHARLPAHQIPELTGAEREFCAPPAADFRRRSEIPHNAGLDSFRVPLKVAQLIRTTICSQAERLATAWSAPHELSLLALVDQIVQAYSGICNLMMTPIPFPLVQMAHTITIFYVFTLPLVFLKDNTGHLLSDCSQIFIITYGFIGLLLVSEELDDPFGDDPNDFDVASYTEFLVDDVLIMIHDADGVESADALRRKMKLNDPAATQDAASCNDERKSLTHARKDSIRLANSATVPDWLV